MPITRRRVALPFALMLCAAVSSAQAPYPVGVRDVAWPNPTGQGSATLTARVHYPATTAGTDAPVLPRAGGWPVVVFLHGFAITGSSYAALGNAWAREGFAVVLGNTAQFDNVGQELDGRATFPALGVANAGTGPFAGAFDLQRVALAGHSMGGGNVGNVLAGNPGYRCGLAFAPVTPRGANAAAVTVPFGIVVGAGDTIAPPATYAQPFHQSLTNVRGMRFLYLLDGDATHTNVPGLFLTAGTATQVFERAAGVGLGMLRHFVLGDAFALEQAIGPAALSEPRLVTLTQEIETPQVWAATALRVGSTVRLSVAAEPGFGGVAAAFALASPTPTPFGDLVLDPATAFVAIVGAAGPGRRLDGTVVIPGDPSFVGVQVAVQAFGAARATALRLGSAAVLTVVP